MDADSRLSVLAIFILLALAALFAVSETAFASASQSKLKVSADRGDDPAATVFMASACTDGATDGRDHDGRVALRDAYGVCHILFSY